MRSFVGSAHIACLSPTSSIQWICAMSKKSTLNTIQLCSCLRLWFTMVSTIVLSPSGPRILNLQLQPFATFLYLLVVQLLAKVLKIIRQNVNYQGSIQSLYLQDCLGILYAQVLSLVMLLLRHYILFSLCYKWKVCILCILRPTLCTLPTSTLP